MYKFRLMKRFILSIAIVLFTLSSFSQQDTIWHDGLQRTYRLHLPSNYSPDSLYPLVINMHGLGSNAWEEEIYTEFNYVSDTGRFIVVYPNGIDNSWNVSSSSGTDDVGFISSLIDTLSNMYGVDLLRVYATGMSMGGFMSYRLACELSNRIAAIGSVTGLQAFYPCSPSRPVPVIDFHGTADPVVPYIGVATTINNWVGYNGCPAEPVITDLPDIDTTDNSTVTVSYYGICNDSSEVLLYTINGGEHTWPGAPILIGITNHDIKASNEIWAFFKKYTLNGPSGVDENEKVNREMWRIYPNPVDGLAYVEKIDGSTSTFNFRLYDLNGRKWIEQVNINVTRFQVDCSLMGPGLYIAEFEMNGVRYHDKVVIH